MERFTIRDLEHAANECCPICGDTILSRKGPRLFSDDSDEPICRDCGKRHAPNLAALLDLASVAERVGRQTRHLLTPPMEALLDLARAAENYSHATPRLRAMAG